MISERQQAIDYRFISDFPFAGRAPHAFDAISCNAITVEGNVKLGKSLSAEKITVLPGGILSAPVLRAGGIEVHPGGTLQGRVEKYTPREVPAKAAPVPEAEPEAEAA